MPFLDQELTPVSTVKDLGITLDSYFNFNDHVNKSTSSLLSMVCQISRVRHLFTKSVLSTILNSLSLSKLFYYSTVWGRTSKQNLQKLKLLQNFAARVLTDTKKFDHISPVLRFSSVIPPKYTKLLIASLAHLKTFLLTLAQYKWIIVSDQTHTFTTRGKGTI